VVLLNSSKWQSHFLIGSERHPLNPS
jgi:hypothetical protein